MSDNGRTLHDSSCAGVGGLNAAVAHLVMDRETGPDNRTTQWSVHCLSEQFTGGE